MDDKNIKQKQFWSGAGGDVWVDKQREMDIMLNPLGQKAIEQLILEEHTKILDIGCGCGATTIEIAKMIPKGHVTGLDISIPMLDRAEKFASEMSLSNIDFHNSSQFYIIFLRTEIKKTIVHKIINNDSF